MPEVIAIGISLTLMHWHFCQLTRLPFPCLFVRPVFVCSALPSAPNVDAHRHWIAWIFHHVLWSLALEALIGCHGFHWLKFCVPQSPEVPVHAFLNAIFLQWQQYFWYFLWPRRKMLTRQGSGQQTRLWIQPFVCLLLSWSPFYLSWSVVTETTR